MAFDINSLQLGAANVSYGGVDFGFTREGVQLDIKTTTRRMDIDHFASVETIEMVVTRMVSVKFKIAEVSIANLILSTGGGGPGGSGAGPTGVINGRTGMELPVGAGRLMQVANRELRLHPVERAASDRAADFVFPNAAWSGTLSHAHRSDDLRMVSVEFFAYRDPNSDALMRFGV